MFGDEGVDASKMGLGFIFLSLVLMFVIYNVLTGQLWANKQEQNILNKNYQGLQMTFHDIDENPVQLPASGAYSFLVYHQNDIEEFHCNICGETTENMAEACIQKHINSDIIISATYDETEGQYIVTANSAKQMFLVVDINGIEHFFQIEGEMTWKEFINSSQNPSWTFTEDGEYVKYKGIRLKNQIGTKQYRLNEKIGYVTAYYAR